MRIYIGDNILDTDAYMLITKHPLSALQYYNIMNNPMLELSPDLVDKIYARWPRIDFLF